MPNQGSKDWCDAVENALGGKEALKASFEAGPDGASTSGAKAYTIADADLPGTGGNGSTWEDVGGKVASIPAFTNFVPSFYGEFFLPADPANGSLSLNLSIRLVVKPSSGAWEPAVVAVLGASNADPVGVNQQQPSGLAPVAWHPVQSQPPYPAYIAQAVDLYLQVAIWDGAQEAVAGSKLRNARVDILS